MPEKTLSVFIDESGDFGPFEKHAPYYLVTMVLHNQSVDISGNINDFALYLANLGYAQHAVHTGPLIRKESIYAQDLMEKRKHLFNSLFNFTRKLDIQYACAKVKKSECSNVVELTGKVSKEIAAILRKNEALFSSFTQVNVYYDNGQIELTKILTSVFNTLYAHVDFRKVKPVDYKLFQVADLICTIELLAEKAELKSFSNSELEFFGSIRDFNKNYLKSIRRKKL